MNKQVEKEFAVMVANLLQTEFCPDWNPKLLHGFMGIASEAGELLNKYMDSVLMLSDPVFERTDTLVELSDLLHYIQMILGVLQSSVSEIRKDYFSFNFGLDRAFYDEIVLVQQCERLDPVLLRGFAGLSSRSGELLNRYKKFMFYHGEPFPRDEMLMELSKLCVYIRMVLDSFDSSFEEIMCVNMAKLDARYPNGYSHDKAITHLRDKKAERVAVEAVIEVFAAMRERADIGEEGYN